jgi:uncharacterized damage-inducible protein DinB
LTSIIAKAWGTGGPQCWSGRKSTPRESNSALVHDFGFTKNQLSQRRSTMSIAEVFLAEFELQAPITRKFLERVPDDKLTWKPHTKSLTAGQLAFHLATVPGGIAQFVKNNPAEAPKSFDFPQPGSKSEILKAFDESVATVRSELPKFSDGAMKETWHMQADGHEVLAMPRETFVRDIMLSHWYQHRGQLCVYLRLLDVAVPSSWGPSADEAPAFMRHAEKVA